MPSWLDAATIKVAIPILTFVLGFFASRWTMTKKERKDLEQTEFENGKELMTARFDRFQEFATALAKYSGKASPVTFDDFMEISVVGEKYFYQQKIVSDAILSGKVDGRSRDDTLVPSIKESIEKSLPTFYQVLQAIAAKKGFEYHGKLERKNYESLYRVVEVYGKQG